MSSSQDKPTIGFAGMTHLGIVMSAVAASRDFDVICYHPGRWKNVEGEPGLDELVDANKDRLARAFSPEALSACDLVFVTLDVPLDENSCPDYEPVENLVREILPYLKEKAVLVIMSQVPPGFTRSINYPHERLFYQVETLVFGESVQRAVYPERIIIGMEKESGGLPQAYWTYLNGFLAEAPLLVMKYESAELAKMANNTMLVASISATNTLAEICEKVGADWTDIMPVLRSDKRIGHNAYLRPGLGVGGGHIERDLHALVALGLAHNTDYGVLTGFLNNSHYRRKLWCFERLGHLRCGTRVAILGLAYKPGTDSTLNSAGLSLVRRLSSLMEVKVYDPLVQDPLSAPTILDCVKGADALVITTPWPEFSSIKIMDLQLQMSGRLILDPYRVLNEDEAVLLGFEYHALGVPPRFPDLTEEL